MKASLTQLLKQFHRIVEYVMSFVNLAEAVDFCKDADVNHFSKGTSY